MFSKTFASKGDIKLSYSVTREFPGDPAGAALLEQARPKETTEGVSHQNLKLLNDLIKRRREGYTSHYISHFYADGSSKFVNENVWDDAWNKGLVLQTYFSPQAIIDVDTTQKQTTIGPRKLDRFPELLTQFPALFSSMGLQLERVRMRTNQGKLFFCTAVKDSPALFAYEADPHGLLLAAYKITSQGLVLRRSSFEYTPASGIWPSRIVTDIFKSDSTLFSHETWDFIAQQTLPNDFSFTPTITKEYRIIDSTDANIPQAELNQLLHR